MKTKASKKIIQEALAQELSKNIVTEKLSDIPSNIIGGIKNAASVGYGAFNTGKINNQLKRSGKRIGKEWTKAAKSIEPALQKIYNSSNPNVKAQTSGLVKSMAEINKDIASAINKMNAVSGGEVQSGAASDSSSGGFSAKGNQGQFLNPMDNPEDFEDRVYTTPYGNQVKESPIHRWVKKMGMGEDLNRIGVHEWANINKAWIEMRNYGINPFDMTPEEARRLLSWEKFRDELVKAGHPDPFLGNLNHFDKIFGAKKAKEMKEKIARAYGVSADELPSVFSNQVLDQQAAAAAQAAQSQAQSAPEPDANFVEPESATPPPPPASQAQARPSTSNPNWQRQPRPSTGGFEARAQAQQQRSEEDFPSSPQQRPPAVNQPASRVPANRDAASRMPAFNPSQLRTANAGVDPGVIQSFVSTVQNPDFRLTKQEREQVLSSLNKEGMQAALALFKTLYLQAASRPAPPTQPTQSRTELRRDRIPALPASNANIGRKPPEAPPEPDQSTRTSLPPEVSEPIPGAFTPPISDFFQELPVPPEDDRGFGDLPVQSNDEETQVGDVDQPAFTPVSKNDEPKEEAKQESPPPRRRKKRTSSRNS